MLRPVIRSSSSAPFMDPEQQADPPPGVLRSRMCKPTRNARRYVSEIQHTRTVTGRTLLRDMSYFPQHLAAFRTASTLLLHRDWIKRSVSRKRRWMFTQWAAASQLATFSNELGFHITVQLGSGARSRICGQELKPADADPFQSRRLVSNGCNEQLTPDGDAA